MNFLLLDIRTYKEYCSGHLCGAILVETPLPPLSYAQKDELQSRLSYILSRNIPLSTLIHVYCKKGIRAEIAVKMLNRMGYNNVKSLGGVELSPLREIMKEGIKVCYCT